MSITNRNFFYTYFMSMVNPQVPDGHSHIVSPYRIISGGGDGRFNLHYSGLAASEAKRYGDTVLTAILKNGEFVSSAPVDYPALLSRPLYIYEYAFSMPTDVFCRAFGQRASLLTARGLNKFNAVAIWPPYGEDEAVRVSFISDQSAVSFMLDKDHKQEPASRYYYEIPPADTSDGMVYYVSAALEGMDGIAPSQFVARWEGGNAHYQPVTMTNPYANSYGEKLLWYIQTRVESFFANPSSLKAEPGADGVYTYSNTNTIVRYHTHDVLEYANYSAIDRSTAADFMTDYSAALSMINMDSYVVNETYLSGYQEDNGTHIFRFDYVINDMPLIMPNGWPTKAEIGHPIEITVDHGIVVRYKKLVYNFHINENATLNGQLSFEALRRTADESLSQIWLGYRMEHLEQLSLYWFWEEMNGNRGTGHVMGTR